VGAAAPGCSPDSDSTVEHKIEGLAFERIDLRDGATLERDRPYLVPLIERLALPEGIRAKANPKSSTGRLDVFTRVLSDRSHRFDEVTAGYQGRLYLEVVPRTFAIRVKTGLALNQVRLIDTDSHLGDRELLELHAHSPLVYLDSRALSARELSLATGCSEPRRLRRAGGSSAGPRRTACRSTSAAPRRSAGATTGAGVRARQADRARPNLLCCCPRRLSASRPPRRGDAGLRPHGKRAAHHYAGFFGRARLLRQPPSGSRARRSARDVSFMVEHANRSASSRSGGWPRSRRALQQGHQPSYQGSSRAEQALPAGRGEDTLAAGVSRCGPR
jgi:dCTP deaminase